MNASLSDLPLVTGSTGDLAESTQELSVLQRDSVGQAGFAPVLEQAHTRIAAEFAALQPGLADAENLLRQVQNLPQAGKLLPLLEQLVEAASADGSESRQLLQRIADTIQQFTYSSESRPNADLRSNADPDSDPGVTLESALTQLLDDISALTAPLGPVTPMNTGARVDTVEAPPAGERANQHALAPLLPRSPVVAESSEKSPVIAGVQSESGSNGAGKLLELLRPRFSEALQPEPRPVEPRQVEMANLMAALKRMTLQTKSGTIEQPQRIESVTAAVTASTGQTFTPSTPLSPTLSVNTPLAQGDWEQALGERIQWMVNRHIQGAQIRLNPAQLGPLEVRLQFHNDQASIQFSSGHGVVREALEAALPRLRDMFDASGVELVNVDISGQSFTGRRRPGEENDTATGGMSLGTDVSEAETVLETPVSSILENGRLDLFA